MISVQDEVSASTTLSYGFAMAAPGMSAILSRARVRERCAASKCPQRSWWATRR